MNVPPLLISQTAAKISISQQFGHLEIHQPKAIVNIHNEQPVIIIDIRKGRQEVEQQRALDAYGQMPATRMNDRIYGQMDNVLKEIIAKRANDGKRMADVHNHPNAISELAKQRSREMRELNFNGPASALNVTVTHIPDELTVDVASSDVVIEAIPQKSVINYTKGYVDIGLLQYPSIDIQWTGNNVDYVL